MQALVVPDQCWINDVWAIGGCYHVDALAANHAIHLRQQLVDNPSTCPNHLLLHCSTHCTVYEVVFKSEKSCCSITLHWPMQ